MEPESVYFDGTSHLFISDRANNRINLWGTNGTAIGWIGGWYDQWQTSTAPPGGTGYKYFSSPVSG